MTNDDPTFTIPSFIIHRPLMIPLSYFLIFWLIVIAIHAVVSFISVIQMTRFSISGPMVYVSTIGFLLVALLVIVTTGAYLYGVDWSQSLDFGAIFSTALPQ